jgi:hypothetical protein
MMQSIKQKKLANAGVAREELTLQEFRQRLWKKGVTPEAFYRLCDIGYKKSVPVDRFRNLLQ